MTTTRAEMMWHDEKLPGSLGNVLARMEFALRTHGWTQGREQRVDGSMCLIGSAKYAVRQEYPLPHEFPLDPVTMRAYGLVVQHLAEIIVAREGGDSFLFPLHSDDPVVAAEKLIMFFNDRCRARYRDITTLLTQARECLSSSETRAVELMWALAATISELVPMSDSYYPPLTATVAPAAVSDEAVTDEVIAEVLASQDRELVPA